MTWQPFFQATCVSSPSVSSSANCARSLASAIEPGRRPSPSEKTHIVVAHDVADLLEVLVQEAFLVTRQAPLRHDATAARHDAGHAVGGQRHIGQPHAGMDGEIIHALFALLDQRVAVDFPVELDRVAVDLLQRLIDRHGADRHRRIAHDPFAGVVDVAAGGQIHHRVGAPADRPHHLVDFFLDRWT